MSRPMIPLFKVRMNPEVRDTVGNVSVSGMITQGKKVEEFEKLLQEMFEYPYILTVNSATSGLTLAYHLAGARDTPVLTVPLTCFAATTSILSAGGQVVWVDIDSKTCNIDLEDAKRKITRDTRVLTFVHWGGHPVNMDIVRDLQNYAADNFGTRLQVVEDCAHAFGAKWKGKMLGTNGNTFAVYSFQAIKHLTTVDGGIIVLPNKETYERAKLLRWYGIDRDRRSLPGKDFRLEPDIPEPGWKYHMNDVTATYGITNLRGIEESLEKCRENAAYYDEQLKDLTVVQSLERNPDSTPSPWIHTICIGGGLKNAFTEYMTNEGIMVSQVHARNDRHSCVVSSSSPVPKLDKLEKEIISIPVGWWVTQKDREHIVKCIRDFDNSVGIEIEPLDSTDSESVKSYTDILMRSFNKHNGETSGNKGLKGVWVLKNNGVIVSSAKLLIEEKRYDPVAHIEDVVTDEKSRGKGFGKMIVRFLTSKARSEGCYKAILSCSPKFELFYLNAGYRSVGIAMEVRFK